MKLQIKYINFGIACRFGNKIYMNKRLLDKKYNKLHDAILKHEKKHSSGFKKKDLINDFNNYELEPVKKEYTMLIAKNPSTWVEYLPFWIYDGKIAFSLVMTSLWVFTIGIGLLPCII